MRRTIAALFAVILVSAIEPAQADPYRWCAEDGVNRGGGTSCYYMTVEQCRAAISGNGGFCVPNSFYDGRPVVAPGDTPSRKRR